MISNGIVLSDEIVINNNLQPAVDLYGSVKPPNWAYNSAGKSSNSYVEIACVCISQHKYKQNYFFFYFILAHVSEYTVAAIITIVNCTK